MRFESSREAVELVNQTGYGLTSGLESLDEREWDYWLAGIHAGNLYINRTTVGAVVLRQPFGGMGKSVFGPGMKAGGPNYVAQFMEFADAETEPGKGHEDNLDVRQVRQSTAAPFSAIGCGAARKAVRCPPPTFSACWPPPTATR